MENRVYEWQQAGHTVRVSFLMPQTRQWLRPLPSEAEGDQVDLAVSPDLLERARQVFEPGSTDDYLEYRCLLALSARFLLRYRCTVFHAASFSWRGRAWLLSAPSGTGKTTQYRNWQRLYPGEIHMISGDMPILELREDGNVWVHPSSWNGKEKYCGAPAAPLGGIVYLEQGKVNQIRPFPPAESVIPLLCQFMAVPETEDQILRLSSILDRMLQTVPCYKLVNRGGFSSTYLLRQTLSDYLDKEGMT